MLSCLIFENLHVMRTVNELTNSYKGQLSVMQDKTLDDDQKQQALLKHVGQQMKYLILLFVKLIGFVSPFIVYVLSGYFVEEVNIEFLYSVTGIITSVVAVFIYIIFRKVYVRLFKR